MRKSHLHFYNNTYIPASPSLIYLAGVWQDNCQPLSLAYMTTNRSLSGSATLPTSMRIQ